MAMEKIKLETADGVEIIGDFYPTENKLAPVVLLLHMMPADRSSWKNFAIELQKSGFQSLAIDLRGHGESRVKRGESTEQKEKTLNFNRFNDAEHQASILDVETAVKFFQDRGLKLDQIYLAGASIGANLALQFQAERPEIKATALLSPGLNYRGIEAEPLIKKLQKNQAVFIITSKEDNYSVDSSHRLFEITQSEKKLKILNQAGHGTTMLEKDKTLTSEIISWLRLRK